MTQLNSSEIEECLQKSFSCSCGREHHTNLKEVVICEGALKSIPELIKKYNYEKAFFLYDSNTYEAAGKQIRDILDKSSVGYSDYVLKAKDLAADEKALGETLVNFDISCDLIIAVGSGTINDICKLLSYKMKLDFFVAATAPSMDGFASSVAAMTINNMKITYEAHVPAAIIADVDIIRNAPMDMITAGVGDILGKYTCLCDWKLSNIINDEYYCDEIVKMVKRSIEVVVENAHLIHSRDSKAIASIMEALVLSGIAMSFIGNSRPASGSEHHLSHYWEMKFLFEHKKPVLHGTKVGIGTIAVLRLYELLVNRPIDFNKARAKAETFSVKAWEENMKRIYKIAAEEVIQLEERVQKNNREKVLKRIDIIERNWKNIAETIDKTLPPADEVLNLLKSLKAPAAPYEVSIDDETFYDSVIAAKEIRNRYGLLQLLFDLGIAEEMAEKVQQYFK